MIAGHIVSVHSTDPGIAEIVVDQGDELASIEVHRHPAMVAMRPMDFVWTQSDKVMWSEKPEGSIQDFVLRRVRRRWDGMVIAVALLCLLTGGCSQFVLYQHNDYRVNTNPSTQPHGVGAPAAPTFPGMLGLSPGLSDLARLAGPDCWVAHSAGAARAVSLIRPGRSPRVLLLIDPWPVNIEVPDGPELVIVVTGRPSVVTVGPSTRAVSKLRAAAACPWAWTVGHLYACRWPESVEAASMAAAHASMASAGSSDTGWWRP